MPEESALLSDNRRAPPLLLWPYTPTSHLFRAARLLVGAGHVPQVHRIRIAGVGFQEQRDGVVVLFRLERTARARVGRRQLVGAARGPRPGLEY